MRSGNRKLFGLALLAPGLVWAVWRLAGHRPARAAPGMSIQPGQGTAQPEAAPTLALQMGDARGYLTVALVFLAAVLFTAIGFLWRGIEDRFEAREQAIVLTRGDPSHAPGLLQRYGCGGCHTVQGVPGADGKVGPDLAGLRERIYVGGVLPNTPDNLIGWIVDPQRYSPHSAMPATGISEMEARDVAAFLYMK